MACKGRFSGSVVHGAVCAAALLASAGPSVAQSPPECGYTVEIIHVPHTCFGDHPPLYPTGINNHGDIVGYYASS